MDQNVDRLLERVRTGDSEAFDRLITELYPRLRQLTRSRLRREARRTRTTVYLQELWIRLRGQRREQWTDVRLFFATAKLLLERIIVDDARQRHAAKRGYGIVDPLPDDDSARPPVNPGELTQFIQLEMTLQRLASEHPRWEQIINYRYFEGKTVAETAKAMGISPKTIRRACETMRELLQARL